MMNKMKKRILALILSITMVFSQNMLAMAEDPTIEEPPVEEAAEEPAAEEPAPVAEEPVVEEPVVEEPVVEEPVVEEPVVEEPVVEEPVVEEPVVEEPVVEEPVVEEPVVEEPVVEEPVVEEPVVEEPVVEEPVVEEPVVEEEIVEEEIFEEPEVATFESGSVKIHAVKGTFSVPSKDVTMTVKAVDGDREMVIAEALTAKLNEEGKEVVDFIVYDIDLWTLDENEEEQKAELALPVEVAFEETGLVADETAEVIGFQIGEDDSVELMDAELNEDGKAVLEPEHFTETGVIVAVNKPAITVYDYKSSEVNVLVTLRNPEDLPDAAELVVTPITLEEEVESDICVEAMKDDIILKEIHAFDIKFMLNGEEVQPGETVKVKISLPGMDMDKDTAVYHIDEQNNIENMDGKVTSAGDVEFETPHFSTYVVVPTVDGNENSEYLNRVRLNFFGKSSGNGITVHKSAQVDDWNKRTYDITIGTNFNLSSTETTKRVADGMMVMDISGSMLWSMNSTGYGSASHTGEAHMVGNYNVVRNNPTKLDPSKVYTIGPSGVRPFVYLDYSDDAKDGWYYYETNETPVVDVTLYKSGKSGITPIPGKTYKDGNWTKIPDNSNWTIYDWSAHRVTTLKQLIRSYIESVAAVTPESYIGMTAFYHEGYKGFDPMAVAGDGDTEMIKRIAAMYPQEEWCTYPNKGLELAFKSMVSAGSSYNNAGEGSINVGRYNSSFTRDTGKYVILFSDGEPDGLSTNTQEDEAQIAQIEKETAAWAKEFKARGVTIYTVAFAYNNSDSTWLNDIASEGCTYTADTMGQLKAALEDIQRQETTKVVDEIPVDVYDYIDDRFVILDNEGNPIGVDYPGIADGIEVTTTGYDGETAVTRTGKVYYDADGRQYIIWDNTKAVKEGSIWTVKVQAKADYIGGNDVTTNIDQLSRIDAGEYGEFDLPDPKVNVKATMQIGNDNVVIYKGTQTPTAHELETDPLTMLYNANAAVAAYLAPGYAGVDAEDFALTWYADAECTTELKLEEIAAAILGEETNYYLKLTYNPGATSDDSNANTTKGGITYVTGMDDGIADGIVEATNTELVDENQNPLHYGVYNVKLWQIVKYANDDEYTPLAGAEFKMTAEDESVYYGKSDETGFVALYTDEEFTNLAAATPIGTYTFEETLAPEGYQLSHEYWTLTASLKTEASLANGVDEITSSTGDDVLKEDPTPDGVVASYVFLNNYVKFDLPNAGGIGTAMFTRAGFGILLGAAWLTIVSRKARREERI